MWTPALLVLVILEIFLLIFWLVNGVYALRIALFWDRGRGTQRQIRLESIAELLVVLVPFTMVLSICSLFLSIFTADSLTPFLTGAMCGFGVFTFTGYGIALLCCKIALALGTGLWLMFNHIDRLNAEQHLLRLRFAIVPFFTILFVGDAILLFLWLQQMHPDTLVSCCGDLFSSTSPFTLPQLLNSLENTTTLTAFASLLVCHYFTGLVVVAKKRLLSLFAISSLALLPTQLLVITLYIAQYAFENPVHRCPFCLLQEPNAIVFWAMYIGILFSAVCGGGTGFFLLEKKRLVETKEMAASCNRMTITALITTTLVIGLMLLVIIQSNYQYGWE
ncbi:MAG: hypothetical protein CSA20_09200 [Deltaproteobacteria bacterium]|nr:MAG: hypothetical protein CSA20_09200 [Deltaproteobacteria bacterium]